MREGGLARTDFSAVLVRGSSALCGARVAPSVGGIILTHALPTPAQSKLAHVHSCCWRS